MICFRFLNPTFFGFCKFFALFKLLFDLISHHLVHVESVGSMVHDFNDREYDKGNKKEIDYRAYKRAPIYVNGICQIKRAVRRVNTF